MRGAVPLAPPGAPAAPASGDGALRAPDGPPVLVFGCEGLAGAERQAFSDPEVDAHALSGLGERFGLVLVDEVDGAAAAAAGDAYASRLRVRERAPRLQADGGQAVDAQDGVLAVVLHLGVPDVVHLDGAVAPAAPEARVAGLSACLPAPEEPVVGALNALEGPARHGDVEAAEPFGVVVADLGERLALVLVADPLARELPGVAAPRVQSWASTSSSRSYPAAVQYPRI